jgi:hypothetical protein
MVLASSRMSQSFPPVRMDGNQMISHFAPENTHLSAPRIDAVTEDEVVIGAATLPFASA